ncbi:uncharacterized protein MELLADRAFT_69714 [Melampsora larici-populina 98AG31]|uniref:Uncharacterized protein n=1 Tax=Melampsora larici-populina (strain 98AG31 / pathotype 3-4-7) TaxID=747676 RepID=F4SBW0_MELLP|nr:uncharacterized protein MELLADRAFT_69714 [Melampsora larici-populina 98AG31]EGF97874.1 hypothetical protein MELLADRAFT_69714 [Melampsora larici-populina 98AG31]
MEEEHQKLKKIKLPQPEKKLAHKSMNKDSDSVDNNLDETKTRLNSIDHDKVSDKNPRFEQEDFENVVTYLSKPEKFKLIYGPGKKTTVTGQTMNCNTSLNTFATHINGFLGKESEDVDHTAKSTEEGDVILEENNNDKSCAKTLTVLDFI